MTITSATAIISKSVLSQNLACVKKLAPNAKVLAVCKANGYGHGLLEVANQLNDADAFGVARIEEAYTLRTGGVVKPIVLLEGFFEASDLPHLVASNIQTVVHCEEQLTAIEQAELEQPIQVWLKIDTGMTRVGINPEQMPEFYNRLKQSSNTKDEVRLMTHFACADEINSNLTKQQIERFDNIVQHLTEPHSLANSAAIINFPNSQREWTRPGIILYGASPIDSFDINALGFKPAMTLSSRLIAVKTAKKGATVGYGATWRCEQDTKVGIVAIGYGDGYPRHAKNGTPVWVNGRIVPLIGRVSMDMITVDLGAHSTDNNGDVVELWGNNLPIEQVAKCASTIPYELMCGLTSRVKLTYQD